MTLKLLFSYFLPSSDMKKLVTLLSEFFLKRKYNRINVEINRQVLITAKMKVTLGIPKNFVS